MKEKIQLKILGQTESKIDEIEGIIVKEEIPPSKRIIIQVRAEDVSHTESILKRYKTMLKNVKESHENIHVTGILP